MVECCSCGRGFRPIFVNALVLGLHVDAFLVWFGIVICFGFSFRISRFGRQVALLVCCGLVVLIQWLAGYGVLVFADCCFAGCCLDAGVMV